MRKPKKQLVVPETLGMLGAIYEAQLKNPHIDFIIGPTHPKFKEYTKKIIEAFKEKKIRHEKQAKKTISNSHT